MDCDICTPCSSCGRPGTCRGNHIASGSRAAWSYWKLLGRDKESANSHPSSCPGKETQLHHNTYNIPVFSFIVAAVGLDEVSSCSSLCKCYILLQIISLGSAEQEGGLCLTLLTLVLALLHHCSHWICLFRSQKKAHWFDLIIQISEKKTKKTWKGTLIFSHRKKDISVNNIYYLCFSRKRQEVFKFLLKYVLNEAAMDHDQLVRKQHNTQKLEKKLSLFFGGRFQ